MACHSPQRFQGFVLLRTMWGRRLVPGREKHRGVRQEWRDIGRDVWPPFSLLSSLCFGIYPGKGAKLELHSVQQGMPSTQTAPLAHSSRPGLADPKTTFLLSRLLKLPCLPHPQLITYVSNASLGQCPPTLWLYFIPVLMVWM